MTAPRAERTEIDSTSDANSTHKAPMFPSVKHVAIAGHIGVGKSTLTQLLSETLDIQAFHEPNMENPFLKRFYSDMSQWAFHSQSSFSSIHSPRIGRSSTRGSR